MSRHRYFLAICSLFLSFFAVNLYAAEDLVCSSLEVKDFLERHQLKSLDIETRKSRKWATNYFKILLDPVRNIQPDRKKKFKATLKASFDNGVTCQFKARIRIHGDWKDHVKGAPALITSLDVKLESGNIDSVVGFKLLLPHTRKSDNEIFVVSLLDQLGFITPKTYYVPTVFNGVRYVYLFQEKARKELLESQLLREAPILEGDERFAWLDTDKHGVYDRLGLARIANENWISKGESSLLISQAALGLLNEAYLEYLTGARMNQTIASDETEYGVFLNPDILANNNAYARRKNNEYIALMIALNATHALAPHNRKFYYDPVYRYLLPIYYDGDANVLGNEISKSTKSFLPSDISGARSALQSLRKIDSKVLLQQYENRGAKIQLVDLERVLGEIAARLENIIESNGIPRNVQNKPYFSTLDEPGKIIAFSGERPLEIVACNFAMSNCDEEVLSLVDYAKLLNGRYVNHQQLEYLYVGTSKTGYLRGRETHQTDQHKTNVSALDGEVKLTLYGSMQASIDRENRVLYLTQKKSSDRALISGGILTDWKIELVGINDANYPGGQRFDENLLTGCLTLQDLALNDVSISTTSTHCEDAINLVRAKGHVSSIRIINSQSDALDADFSDLEFSAIDITNAGNDCFDFSAGTYVVETSNLSQCSDKAISVGEGSTTKFNKVVVRSAEIGIAVKDSSISEIDSAEFYDVTYCLVANRKKQEFWGSEIKVRSHNCADNRIVQEPGSLIEVRG